MTSTDAPLPHPGVRIPPPLLFFVGLILGWALDRYLYPFPLASGSAALTTIGIIVAVSGAAFAAWGVATFRRARTAIVPLFPASRLVISGPYRYSRNPMYVGLTAVYLGLTLSLHTTWPLLLLPIVLLVLVRWVIEREEAYLRGAFGMEYEGYMGRVRRWL